MLIKKQLLLTYIYEVGLAFWKSSVQIDQEFVVSQCYPNFFTA